MQKTCSKCGEAKDLAGFNRHPHGQHGRHPRCKACRSVENSKRYIRVGPTQYDADKNRKDKYGLTPEAYEALLKKQDGVCGICREDRPLVVDHCHEAMTVRGLLCGRCNQGLGKLGDTVEGLRRALAYLIG